MAWPRSEGLTKRVIGPCEEPRVRATISRPFLSCSVFDESFLHFLKSFLVQSRHDEYEFGVCECFDRNRLLALDDQSFAGMYLHSVHLNFACRGHQIACVAFAEGITSLTASPKQDPVHFGVAANRQRA